MNPGDLKKLQEYTEHAEWLKITARKAREAAKLIQEDGGLVIAIGSLEMTIRHTDHRLRLVTAFNELADHVTEDFKELEAELEP